MSPEKRTGNSEKYGSMSRSVSWADVAQKVAGPYFYLEADSTGSNDFSERLIASFTQQEQYWIDIPTARKFRNESTYVSSLAHLFKDHPEGKPIPIRIPPQDQGYVVLLSAYLSAKSLTQKEIVVMVEDNDIQVQNRVNSFEWLKSILCYIPSVVHQSQLEDQLETTINKKSKRKLVRVPPRIVVANKNKLIDIHQTLHQYELVPRLYMFETDMINSEIRSFIEDQLQQERIVLIWKPPILERTDNNNPLIQTRKKRILALNSDEEQKNEMQKEIIKNLPPEEVFYNQTFLDLDLIDDETYIKNRRRVSRRLWRQLFDVFRDHPDWSFEKICTELNLDPRKHKDKFGFRYQSMADEFNGVSRSQTSPVQYLASLCEEMMPEEIVLLPGADFLTPNQLNLLNYMLKINNEEDLLDLTYSEIKDALGLVHQAKAKELIELIARTVLHPENLNTPRAIFLKATGIDLARPNPEAFQRLIDSISEGSVMGKRTRYRLNQFLIAFQTKPNGSYEELGQLFKVPMKFDVRNWMNSILEYLDKKLPFQPRSPASYIKEQTGLEYAVFISALLKDKFIIKSLTPDDVRILTCFSQLGPEVTYESVAEVVLFDRTTVFYHLKKAVNKYLSVSMDNRQLEVKKLNPYATLVSEIGMTPPEILRQPFLTKSLYPEDVAALKFLTVKAGDQLTIYGLGHLFNPPISYPEVIRMIRRIGILVKRELEASAKRYGRLPAD